MIDELTTVVGRFPTYYPTLSQGEKSFFKTLKKLIFTTQGSSIYYKVMGSPTEMLVH